MENYLISVDMGGSKVTAALGLLSHQGETILVDAVTQPMSGFNKGEVTNIEHVTTAIRSAVTELERRHDVKASEVWVSVSGKHIVCADNSGFVFVGGVDGEITEKDVDKLHENMNNVQAPEGKVILTRYPQNYKVDSNETLGSPIGRFGHRLETKFSFILAGKSVLDRITKALERAKLGTPHFVSGAIASATVVATEQEKESGVVVIDFGADATDLCIIQNNIVRYVASIPMGSSAINKDISTAAIPQGKIEMLKTRCGYATTSAIPADKINKAVRINTHLPSQKSKEITYRDLTTIIYARMLDIIEYVNAEIKASGFHNRLPGGIVLTGGGSQLGGIEVIFKEHTGYDVRLGSAECNISGESMKGYSQPELACAIGLLSIGMEESGLISSDYSRPEPVEPTEKVVVEPPVVPTPTTPTTTPTDGPTDKPEGPATTPNGPIGQPDGPTDPPTPKGKKLLKWLHDRVFGPDVEDDDFQ